ncbi:MAG: helix-turn-helix transcriptional regulator [Verrucomicrobiota bacterium]
MSNSTLQLDLAALRENAGLTAREMARQLGIHHTTLLQWEDTGRVAKSEYLDAVSKILGVSIEELLGLPRTRKTAQVSGKMGQLFDAASRLPRGQQSKIIAVLEPFIKQHDASTV